MDGEHQHNIFNRPEQLDDESKEEEANDMAQDNIRDNTQDNSQENDSDTRSTNSDDSSNEFWDNMYSNEVIIPAETLISSLLGLSSIQFIPVEPRTIQYPPFLSPPPLQSSQVIPPIQQRIRPREETQQQSSEKALKNELGEKTPLPYNYLRLKSGIELKFLGDESNKLVTPRCAESNYYIRNIIAKIPQNMIQRMKYLAQFESEEELEDGEIQTKYEGNLKELVYEAYIKEWLLKFQFKRLLNIWRIYKMNKNCEKEIDPITLFEPEKEVQLYDWSVKRKFIFDAKSLSMLIESKLLYHEYGFPVPLMPKNPKNNVELNYKQLITVYNQIKLHGELRWAFMTLREHNFNKNMWHLYNKSSLTINSIKTNIIQLDTNDGRDLLLDFIFSKMDDFRIGYTTTIYNIYQKAMIRVPDHWYLAKLKSLAISHYEAEHFGHNRNNIINTDCLKIFNNEKAFFNDLRKRKIIT